MAGDRLTQFLRRTTSIPTLTLFRLTNFELYSRNNLAVAVPGTALFLGVVTYFAMMRSDAAQLEREAERRSSKHDDT